jgi:DNA-directed RNA polymerase subunit beta
VPGYVVDIRRKTQQNQTILLGSIPLMSFRGTFVINGVSRCIVSQLLRKPGIYYSLSLNEIYTATIICNSGKRIKIELDKKGYLWIRINKSWKAPLVLFLIAMGVDFDHIPQPLRQRTKKLQDLPFCVQDAMKDFCYQFKQKNKKTITEDSIYDQFYLLFVSNYQLGYIGRLNLNKRLNLYTSEKEVVLRSQDLIIAAEYLIKVSLGLGNLDDIDDLKHKYVKSVSNLFSEHLRTSLDTLSGLIQNTLNKIITRNRSLSPKNFVSSNAISFQRYLASYQLSQFLDQTNPLSEIIHKRKRYSSKSVWTNMSCRNS